MNFILPIEINFANFKVQNLLAFKKLNSRLFLADQKRDHFSENITFR